MDLGSLVAGTRTIRPDEVAHYLPRKLIALRSAYQALGDEVVQGGWEAFVAAVPASILGSYFASDGIDQHYTRLLGGISLGEPNFDAMLATTINFLLGELTYQGRYLAKYEPEALVVAGGSTALLNCALANASKIEAFKVGVYDEPDMVIEERVRKLALNNRPLVWGSPEKLADVITTKLGRPLGCLAMLNLGLPDECAMPYAAIADPLRRHFTPDTFHVFAGEASAVYHVRERLHAQFPNALLLHRHYSIDAGGALLPRAVLIATQIDQVPTLDLASSEDRFGWYPAGADLAQASGLSMRDVRPPERIDLEIPTLLTSSAPLSDEQIRTITDPITIAHNVATFDQGRVIHSESIFERCYAIATRDNQLFEQIHLSALLAQTPYGKPDANGVVTVPRKAVARVDGPALLFAFSPSIIAYHSHFLLQCFPRVITAEALGEPDMRLLIPSGTRSYQRRMLEMVGWNASRLIDLHPEYDYICDRLHVPNIAPAIFSPWQSQVYDRLIGQVESQPIPYRRIIISRSARTTWRNMLNYDAVCELLVRDYGFEVVEPDKLTIEDEIRLFQASEIVVGAEGAGLYNCCFMAPDTDVIVLADQDYVMYVVGSMARIRSFNLSFVFGESFQADRDLERRAGHADFVVDPLRVRDAVAAVISRREHA